MPKTNGNSPKERKLKQGVLAGKEPTQAALDAGYSPKTASQIAHNTLKKPHINAEIELAAKEAAKNAGVDAEWIATKRREIADRCMQAKPVLNKKGEQVWVETADGDMAPAFVFDSAGANSALSGLAKMVGCDTEKIEHTGDADKFGIKIVLNPGGNK